MQFTRSKKVQKEYKEKIKTLNKDECFICDRELLECEFEYWVLLRNRYPYSVKFLWWDIPVKNHYLLCPKRHIGFLEDLKSEEWEEHNKLIYDKELLRFGFDFDYSNFNTSEESSFKYHVHNQIIELGRFLDFLNRLV